MRLPSPVIVGRHRERTRLLAGAARPPALVLIEGEAGVGKTRLARELAEADLLTGHCCHLREPLPFGPVVEALRGLATKPGEVLSPVTGVLRPLLPELAAWLPAPPEPAHEHGTARHRLFRAVLELLSALGPVTVVLEDLHWADEGTVELLRYLTYRMPPGLCLVLTYRREELPDGSPLPRLAAHLPPGVSAVELRLDPLPVPAVRALVGEILGEGVSAQFAHYLHEHTAGLPFAVEEVLRQLADAPERHALTPRLERLGVPPALRHSLLDRLERLGSDARRLVNTAAVLRVPAAEQLLGAVAELDADATTAALSEAVARGLLTEQGDRYGLRHALARQVVYDAQPAPARRRLHRRAAETLARQSPPPCVQLAHHWREAGDAGASRRYAERGAEAALAVGDDATAVGLLCRALSTPDVPAAARIRMAVMLSKAAHSGLDNSETIAILRGVLERDRMPRAVRGELRFYLASLLYNQAGSRAAAMAEVARAVPELRDRPALAARAMSTLALPIHVAGEPIADQLAWLEPARQAAAQADDPVIRLAVLGNRATALAQVGDAALWRAARELRDHSPDSPAERYQLVRSYQNLANATILIGHYTSARRYLAEAEPLVTETGSAYLASAAESIRLVLDWATGQWDGVAERARRHAEAHWDIPELSAEARMVAGRLALAAGDLAGAERMLTDALDAVALDGTVPVLPVAIAGLARIWLATGRTARAGKQVANAVAAIRRKGAWVWVAELAGVGVEALARAGLTTQARELVDDFAAGLAGRDAPLATAALSTAEASLSEVEGRPLEAAALFERACRAYQRIARPFDAALALEGRGRCLLADGRDGAAALHEAIAILERLGAPWPASRCRRTLRQHGVSARRGRRGYGMALSPREREVAALAARGQTNREIAAALFLSPRTVEEHVAKALRKLGLSTRAELPELIP